MRWLKRQKHASQLGLSNLLNLQGKKTEGKGDMSTISMRLIKKCSPYCFLMFSCIIEHDQLRWRIENVLNFNWGEPILLFFNEANNFWIEYQFPHADLKYRTRISNLQLQSHIKHFLLCLKASILKFQMELNICKITCLQEKFQMDSSHFLL